MEDKKKLAAPCGLYCGVCAIYIAHKENNLKFKERLPKVYGVSLEEIRCEGCLSDDLFKYCQVYPIRSCAQAKGFEGCHQCNDFPCKYIDNFPIPVGKKVIFRSVPAWRKMDGRGGKALPLSSLRIQAIPGSKEVSELPASNRC